MDTFYYKGLLGITAEIRPLAGPANFDRFGSTTSLGIHNFVTLKRFMSKLLEGKLALILGIANKWSLAYSIAQAFHREGATLALTYLGEKQKQTIEEFAQGGNDPAILPCD